MWCYRSIQRAETCYMFLLHFVAASYQQGSLHPWKFPPHLVCNVYFKAYLIVKVEHIHLKAHLKKKKHKVFYTLLAVTLYTRSYGTWVLHYYSFTTRVLGLITHVQYATRKTNHIIITPVFRSADQKQWREYAHAPHFLFKIPTKSCTRANSHWSIGRNVTYK